MRDTATLLPILCRLSDIAHAEGQISSAELSKACAEYEDEMIPRSFGWVQKSGGSKLMVPSPASEIQRLPLTRVTAN